MGPFWIANLIVMSVSVMIFAIILVSYVKSYLKFKAGSFGNIIAFSSILLMQGVIAIIIYYSLSLHFGSGLAFLLLAINIISLSGYIVLYKALEI
ncbi:MAG: hypothetical protein ACYCSO_06510 [Cuniculiplasma sp.]